MKAGDIISAVLGSIMKFAIIIAALFVIYRGANMCYDYGYRLFTEPAVSLGSGRNVTVAITSDMSPFDIGNYFEEQGLTRDAKLFALQYIFSEYKKDVKAGVFELSTAMTAEEMMAVMAGDTQDLSISDEAEEDAEDYESTEMEYELLDEEEGGDYSAE